MMELADLHLSRNHQLVVDRFVITCQADERIVAAFLGGSYVTGTADVYSDLDLYLITTDEVYEDFLTERETFLRQLGQPLFLEDFGTPYAYFFIFADGTEGELWIGRESHFQHIHGGAYTVLLDKQNLLQGVEFPRSEADQAEQAEVLRQQISYFWHEMLHFVKAIGREQLWFAYGQLEALRQICVNLTRLQHNFLDPDVDGEPYFKIEQTVPVEKLAPLESTCCSLETKAMLQAALVIFRFYQQVAPPLAKDYGISYHLRLEHLVTDHLEKLSRQHNQSQR